MSWVGGGQGDSYEEWGGRRVSVRWEHEIRKKCVHGVVLSKTQMKQILITMQEHNSGTGRLSKNNSYMKQKIWIKKKKRRDDDSV